MSADLATLQERILAAVKDSALGPRVTGVAIEPDHYDETDFLRVIVRVTGLDDEIPDDENIKPYIALIESIEDTVIEVDERYPSVRFSDAA